jgi:hypothetical protein
VDIKGNNVLVQDNVGRNPFLDTTGLYLPGYEVLEQEVGQGELRLELGGCMSEDCLS